MAVFEVSPGEQTLSWKCKKPAALATGFSTELSIPAGRR
jgi:hypothetical protein